MEDQFSYQSCLVLFPFPVIFTPLFLKFSDYNNSTHKCFENQKSTLVWKWTLWENKWRNKLMSVLLEYLQSWLPDVQCSGCPSSLKFLRVVSQFSEIRGYFKHIIFGAPLEYPKMSLTPTFKILPLIMHQIYLRNYIHSYTTSSVLAPTFHKLSIDFIHVFILFFLMKLNTFFSCCAAVLVICTFYTQEANKVHEFSWELSDPLSEVVCVRNVLLQNSGLLTEPSAILVADRPAVHVIQSFS